MVTTKLVTKDYKNILDFYNIDIPTNKKAIKEKAESIMADKLCKCIKSVKKKQSSKEGKAISICTNSIFTKRGYTRGKFKCLTNKKRKTVKIGKRI